MLKITRNFLFIFLALFSASSHAVLTLGCPPPLAAPNPEVLKYAATNAKDHAFLWKITKQNSTSYLYGTIHVGKLNWMFPGPTIKQAILTSDVIALEMDMADPDIQAHVNAALKKMRPSSLPDELVNSIKKLAESECAQYEALAKVIPELQVITLGILQGRRDQFEVAYGIDSTLSGFGHALGKRVISLETPELQFSILQMKTQKETVEFVKDSIDKLSTGQDRQLLKRIADIWVKSDFAQLSDYALWCDCLKTDLDKKLMKRMLDDRNINLAKDIDTLHTGGKKMFIAVGSLHMVGQQGLPALLEKRGYKVERVDFQNP